MPTYGEILERFHRMVDRYTFNQETGETPELLKRDSPERFIQRGTISRRMTREFDPLGLLLAFVFLTCTVELAAADDFGGWGEFRWGNSPQSAMNASRGTLIEESASVRSHQESGELPITVRRSIDLLGVTWLQEARFACGSIGLHKVVAEAPAADSTYALFSDVRAGLIAKYGNGKDFKGKVDPDDTYWLGTAGETEIFLAFSSLPSGKMRLGIVYRWLRWDDDLKRRASCRNRLEPEKF